VQINNIQKYIWGWY